VQGYCYAESFAGTSDSGEASWVLHSTFFWCFAAWSAISPGGCWLSNGESEKARDCESAAPIAIVPTLCPVSSTRRNRKSPEDRPFRWPACMFPQPKSPSGKQECAPNGTIPNQSST
jgi:hypothetical protein